MSEIEAKAGKSEETTTPTTLQERINELNETLAGKGITSKLITDIDTAANAYSKIDGASDHFIETAMRLIYSDSQYASIFGQYISSEAEENLQKFVLIAKDGEIVKAIANSEVPETAAQFTFQAISLTSSKELALKALEVKQFFEREIKSYDASINDLIAIMTKGAGSEVGVRPANESKWEIVGGAEGFVKPMREGATLDTMLITILGETGTKGDGAELVLTALQGIDNYTPRSAAIYLAYIYDAAIGPAGLGLLFSTNNEGNPFARNKNFLHLVASEEFADSTNKFKGQEEKPEDEMRRLIPVFKWAYDATSQIRGEDAEDKVDAIKDLVSNCKNKEMYDELFQIDPENFNNMLNTPGINLRQIKSRDDLLRAATLANLVAYWDSRDYDLLNEEQYKKVKNPRADKAYTYVLSGGDGYVSGEHGYIDNTTADELASKVKALPANAMPKTYEDLARAYLEQRYGVGKSAGLTLDGLYAFSCMDHKYRIATAESFAK